MKKRVISILLLMIFIAQFIPADASSGFSSNPDAIERAAKSVLMLQVFDDDNKETATGSGFVAFNNRTIVTNYHVIEDAAWMLANSDDGYQYMITKVLVADKEKDIAICGFMSPTDLQPLEFNTDGELKRAENVVAIGSPRGFTNTVSLGNISAVYRDEALIQFTAPISHGSSGGALFDDSGRVIGITSRGYDDAQNLNFAVHISEVETMYKSWNGLEVSLDEFMAISNATPTPASTATSAPTLKPTEFPKGYRLLRKGDTGADVQALQEKLIELGYLVGEADGVFDIHTENAIKEFGYQAYRRYDIIAATIPIQKLLFEGNPPKYEETTPKPQPINTPEPYAVLKMGSTGDVVKRLQEKLIELGYLDGEADGIFGAKTEEAVILFNSYNFGAMKNEVATNGTQKLLFDGNPKQYKDADMTLAIVDGARIEWDLLSGDKLSLRFQVTNEAKKKTVKAFEIYVYAVDVWGNEIYGNDVYYATTVKSVAPGKTVFTDFITIPSRSQIHTVYVGIHKVAYTDGTTHTVDERLIDYSGAIYSHG